MFVKFCLTLVLLFVPLTVSAQLFAPPMDDLLSQLTIESGISFIKDDSKNPDSPTVCVAPPANLVAWYRGEGNASDSQGANNGTLEGGADFVSAIVGNGFRFDAADEHLLVPASASLNVGASGSLTLEAWVNPTSPNPGGSGYGPIFEWGNGSGVQLGRFNNGQLFANVVDTGVNNHFIFTPDNTLTTNQFQHVALTYTNATGIGTIYVNGVAVATQNLGGFTPRTNSELRLGVRNSSDSFNGIIDEPAIYNRALSQSEIQAIVNAGSAGKCVSAACTPQPTNGISWYKAENNGSDSLGANDGTMLNGADFAPGIIGSGFRFDAPGEQLLVPASPSLNVGVGGSLTLEAWVNPTSPNPGGSGEGPIIEWGHNSGVLLGRQNNGQIYANVQDAGVNNHFMFTPDNTLTINQFQHVALTYTNATGIGTIYVNGAVILSQNLGSFTPRTTNELHLGLSAGSNSFNGIIDEAAIYNRALSQTEIQTIFNAGSAGKCNAPLRISPPTATVAAGGSINFTATGGAIPRTFSIATNNSGGSINPTTGVYTAGAAFGADTVRVTDASSQTSDATITITAACVAGEKTWDGGGATNDWSEAANWTCDLVPTATDTIIFDGSSTKNATIDTSRAVKSLNINAGYTGTITQADATTLAFGAANSSLTNSSQAGGTFVCGSGAISFNNVIFTQTGGQFDCQNGTIGNSPSFDLRINGGIFNAPSGTMTFGGTSLLTLGAGGTFNHNNGTIAATGSFFTFGIVSSAATLDFNNLTIDLAENLGGAVAGSEADDRLRVWGTLNLVRGSLGTGTIEAQGAVNIGSTFLDAAGGGGFFVLGGGNNQTYTNNGGSNPKGNISINKTSGTVTAATSLILLTGQPLNITSGTLYLSNSANLRAGALTIGANGRLVNDSSTTITLGGNLTNDGTIDLQGGGANCPETDSILIRSSSAAQRSWTGGGRYRLVDVDVQNMSGTGTKTVFSGTNSGGNNASWVFNSGCPTALVISPLSANVPAGATQTFTASGGSPNYTFSITTNNSGAAINPTTGVYTAGTTAGAVDTVRVTDAFGSTADATVNVSSSSFVVTNNSDTGAGSLRQAITNANITPGTQTVSFNIAGTAPFGIFLLSDLPLVIDPIIIDGTTQPGYAGSPIIKIFGNALNGLQILNGGNGSIIKGLHLSGFDSAAIRLNGGGGNIIQGNYIGRMDESSSSGNFTGIDIFLSPNNVIGGSTASERNVISGNTKGINIGTSDNTMVRGNYIGTNPAGTTAIGNSEAINLTGSRNCSIISNVISGNFSGIVVFGNFGLPVQNNPVQNNLIQNNIIGLDASGANPLGNGLQGILIGYGATGNRLTGNRIFANGRLGIKVINSVGYDHTQPLLNDPQDADVGANHLQNYPVLTFANTVNGTTSVSGILGSTPNSTFTLEFFSSPSCDASGNGEGETFLGSGSVTTNASGIVEFFSLALPVVVADGRFITATATDAIGNTSEFSRCQIVGNRSDISGRVTKSGQPMANVQLRLTDPNRPAFFYDSITDSNGEYILRRLPRADYTVTISHPNHTFTPPSRFYADLSANQTGQNYTAVQPRFSLSGNVLSTVFTPNIASGKGGANFMPPAPVGSFPMARVNLNLSGATNATVITNDFGVYNFPNLPPGTYTVTPSKTNYVFTPPSAAVVIGSGNQGLDFVAELEVATLTGRIIYESRSGDIKAMNANGSGIVTFTETSSKAGLRYSSPNLSPNGSRAVYARQRNGSVSQTGINTINADGSNVVTVLTGEGLSAPVFSPDGSRIAFNNTERRLMVMNTDGSNPSPITDNCTEPDWSPDGTKLVCVETPNFNVTDPDSNIVTVNANGTNRTIINNTGGRKLSPRWSPDGSRIAFVQQIRIPRNNSLIVMNANGTNAATILSHTRTVYGTVSWSPDGARLALIRDRGFEARNNTPNANGADRELITIQPDGQALLVIEDEFDGNKLDWGVSNSIPTPTSTTPVTIQSGSISITFPNVGGTNPITTITPIAPGSAGTAPNTFAYGDFAFEISTTATFTPPVTICINLNTLSFRSVHLMPPASRPRFIHIENGTPVNITTNYNSETNVLCGQTSSFSPFIIAEEIDPNLPQITGLVVDSNGSPLSGVNVNLTGTETRRLQTDSNGIFRFVNLTAGGNYNVQPRELGFLFAESNQDFVNLTGENTIVFTGAANDFQISGRVADGNGNGIGSIGIALDGASSGEVLTDAKGNYVFANLPADGDYSITAFSGGHSFAPPQIFIGALAGDVAGADFTRIAPTAANVTVGGRVTKGKRGIEQAEISMTDANGNLRTVQTDRLGFYEFENIAPGGTYIVTVGYRNYQFTGNPRILSVNAQINDLNFTVSSLVAP